MLCRQRDEGKDSSHLCKQCLATTYSTAESIPKNCYWLYCMHLDQTPCNRFLKKNSIYLCLPGGGGSVMPAMRGGKERTKSV